LFRTASAHEAVPGRIASAINQVISDNNETNMFVTLFIGSLDLATGEMDYSNAGHDAPLLMGTEGIGLLPVDSNLPIGVTADWEFSTQHTTIHHGTMIFLYTDGLTEAENIKHMQFGEERIFDVAQQAQTKDDDSPETLIHSMTDAVSIFVGEAEQSDDLTMLTIKYC
jgi:sigma-B regulation protein RsbU (phosphoserine phosphatase)